MLESLKSHGLKTGLFLLSMALVLWVPIPGRGTEPTEHTFKIEASTFSFDPAVIRVNPGDLVTIDLVALDVVHGLAIDGYDIAVTADPGQTVRLSFTADRSGVFKFRCAVACGALHPFMTGKLQVGPNLLFWRGVSAALVAAFFAVIFIPRRVNQEVTNG